jgi:adenylate cyclase
MHDFAFANSIRAQQRDVTLLFADLRGFTELAASLEIVPLVSELAAHVMDCLTEAVADHDGCVVDYFGDGLLAMWNAPADQPDHPERACRAGLAMLERLPAVAADWAGALPADLRLGIGIHTGAVQVGNAGSTRQAKYGPRGPNVHLASRVEAATKSLAQPLLATASTVERLSNEFAANRVCRAQMPGLPRPVELFAVRLATADAGLAAAWHVYAAALRHFEDARYEQAADVLASAEPQCRAVPWRFLAEEVQRELGRQQRRRSTDKPKSKNGVIALHTK